MEESRKTIIIAEKDNVVADILQTKLLDLKFEVIKCWSGEEILRKLKSKEVDLLLINYDLVDMTADRLISSLGQDKKPAIVLTDLVDQQEVNQCLESGVDVCLVKSYSQPDDIIKKVLELTDHI